MDVVRIQGIQKQALEEGWNYAREIDELRRYGVARIRMKLMSGETEFTDDKGATITVCPLQPVERECTEALDPAAIDAARQRYLRQEIDLGTFFDLLAVAGVWFYDLDTRSKAVSHYDWKEQLQYDGDSTVGPAATSGGPEESPATPVRNDSVLIRTYTADCAG